MTNVRTYAMGPTHGLTTMDCDGARELRERYAYSRALYRDAPDSVAKDIEGTAMGTTTGATTGAATRRAITRRAITVAIHIRRGDEYRVNRQVR